MKVVVWSISFRCPSAWLCDTEEEAASFVLAVEESDRPQVVLGVQFEDGRLIEANDFEVWEVYQALVKSREELTPKPTEPRRTARSPFVDGTGARAMTSVPESYPAWVGA